MSAIRWGRGGAVARKASDVMWEAVQCWVLEGFVTMSATRWGRRWAVARKVRVTSCGSGAVLRSRGFCHDVCHTVGKGVGCGEESTSDVMSMPCGVEISRGLSRCLPHGGGGVSTIDVMLTSSRKNGRETRLFSLTAFGEEVFFWDGNLERPRGKIWRRKVEKCKSRFPSEVRENTGELVIQPLRVSNSCRRIENLSRSRECLVPKAHRERDSSRRTLLTSEGRKKRLLNRQTLKRKPLGKRKALEFLARTRLCKMCSGKQLGGAPVENPKRTSIVEADRKLAGNCGNQAEQSNTKSSRQPETKRAGSHLIYYSPNPIIFTTADGL